MTLQNHSNNASIQFNIQLSIRKKAREHSLAFAFSINITIYESTPFGLILK